MYGAEIWIRNVKKKKKSDPDIDPYNIINNNGMGSSCTFAVHK